MHSELNHESDFTVLRRRVSRLTLLRPQHKSFFLQQATPAGAVIRRASRKNEAGLFLRLLPSLSDWIFPGR